jgi:hypothetical protein
VIVALILGGLIGFAGESNNSSELEDEVTSLEGKLASTEGDLKRAEEVSAITKSKLRATADERAELKQKEAKLNDRAQSISGEEEEAVEVAEKSEIEDGIWQVGVDIEPGTYRPEGGSGCYWALLNSADTSDIENNGGFSPNQTLTIDSAWFQTDGCGVWEKIE